MSALNGFNYKSAQKELLSSEPTNRDDTVFYAVPMDHPFFTIPFTAEQGEHLSTDDLGVRATLTDGKSYTYVRPHMKNTLAFEYKVPGHDPYFSRARIGNQHAALPAFSYTTVEVVPPKPEGTKSIKLRFSNYYIILMGRSLVTDIDRGQINYIEGDNSANARAERSSTETMLFRTENEALTAFLAEMRNAKFSPLVERKHNLTFNLPMSGDLVSIPLSKGDISVVRGYVDNLIEKHKFSAAATHPLTGLIGVRVRTFTKLPTPLRPYMNFLTQATAGIRANLPSALQIFFTGDVTPATVRGTGVADTGYVDADRMWTSASSAKDMFDVPADVSTVHTIYFPNRPNLYNSFASMGRSFQDIEGSLTVRDRTIHIDTTVRPSTAPERGTFVASAARTFSMTSNLDEALEDRTLEEYAASELHRFIDMAMNIRVISKDNADSFILRAADKLI